jgi:VWFA-related protein
MWSCRKPLAERRAGRMVRPTIAGFILVAFSSVLLSAQAMIASSGIESSQTVPTIRVTTQLVLLDALVESKKPGSFVGTLTKEDFQLSEDGVPQSISYFSHDELPLSIVFLFDLTDTVRPVLKPLARGARDILTHLKPLDETAIMVFDSHTELLQDFTTDRSLAAGAIDRASRMKTDEGTFIHEDMYEAAQQAMRSKIPGSRRVLIWLTDGTANLANSYTRSVIGKHAPVLLHTREDASDKLLRWGVVVAGLMDESPESNAAIFAGNSDPWSMLGGTYTGDVRRYAEMTGGPVLEAGSKDTAIRLAALIDQLRDRYTLGYKPAAAQPEGTFCRLKLQLQPEFFRERPGLKKKNMVVRTKRGYYR